MADAGFKAIMQFETFQGTSGAEFYEWMRSILAQLIAALRRQRAALRKGGVRRFVSLESEREAARLAELLISTEHSPQEAAMIRENATRLRRAIGRLNFDERRALKLRLKGRTPREIAALFGHAPSWAQHILDGAARHLRATLERV